MKKETIEKLWIAAVGEKIYSLIKNEINADGWCVDKLNLIPVQLLFVLDGKFNDSELRPRTLRGIEDNLGWSKPKENGLPKKTGIYIFLCEKKIQTPFYLSMPLSKEEASFYLKNFTYYKQLKSEPLPLH